MDVETLARQTKVEASTVLEWLDGSDSPTKTQWGLLATALKRSRSTFLLPEPPPSSVPPELRIAAGYNSHTLRGDEALQVRRARRMQRYLERILSNSPSTRPIEVPKASTKSDPAIAGDALRAWLQVTAEDQLSWSSPSEALAGWRSAVEVRGVMAFQMRLGREGVRGFALPHDIAPVVAFNSAETGEARCFTLLHELAHLSLGEATSCALPVLTGDAWPVERWCDKAAAAALMPRDLVRAVIETIRASPRAPVGDVALVRRAATRMKSSLRATAVRLEELEIVGRGTFDEVDRRFSNADREKPSGGPASGGESSPELRHREFGHLGGSLVLSGLQAELITERDARDLLRLDGPGLQALDQLLEQP